MGDFIECDVPLLYSQQLAKYIKHFDILQQAMKHCCISVCVLISSALSSCIQNSAYHLNILRPQTVIGVSLIWISLDKNSFSLFVLKMCLFFCSSFNLNLDDSMCFLFNDIADDVVFSFTNNVSCLEILFSSYFEVEVKCFKNHLSNNTSLKPQAALNKFRG